MITKSQASEYSQILLTPKPDDKWRFCIDFRALNETSESMGWPIPNIKLMLQRLGSKRAKFFCVIDLTSGYYQAPLSEESRWLTAFITFFGIFEWLRVPMGLKGAPSYFQQMMATIVLAGLIYYICEAYLDDIIVYAETEEELVQRLREVFERFRKFRLTLNPDKCQFGVNEVEYVGHVINESGLSFSREKLNKVLVFPIPVIAKGLKCFLGLANYFRDHVRNHSIIVKPLHDMLKNYDKHRKLIWTKEGQDAFYLIKEEINKCPTLFFMEEHSEVFLYTDASDYGIGAYLFQKGADGVEKPTAFISKSLIKEQLGWSVPEKEAYAIYYALTELSYLIRDIHFTLKTDHKNLIYINTEGSPKVKRWKLQIQEFDFDIEHVAGVDNVVADSFSRLCAVSEETEEFACTLLEEFKIPKDKY